MLDAVTAPYTLDLAPATSALAPDEPAAAALPPGPSSTPATPALPAVIGDRAALRAVLAREDLSSSARLTWIALFAHADATSGAAWPSVPTLARETGCAVRTVRYALRALEKAGLATPARRPGRSTVYRVHLPRQAPPAPLRLTPARDAPTPARGAGGPRQHVPPERNRGTKKEILTRPHARGGTPATAPARTPAGVTPYGPAGAGPTGPTAPATAPGGPIPLPVPPSARTTPASPAALAAALAAHLAGDTPATRPGPATVRPDPSGEGDLPGELGATLARLRARVVAGRS